MFTVREKLISLDKDTPEGEEVAKAVKHMIKELMQQIDDIEVCLFISFFPVDYFRVLYGFH